jgi:hypothetical protein
MEPSFCQSQRNLSHCSYRQLGACETGLIAWLVPDLLHADGRIPPEEGRGLQSAEATNPEIAHEQKWSAEAHLDTLISRRADLNHDSQRNQKKHKKS